MELDLNVVFFFWEQRSKLFTVERLVGFGQNYLKSELAGFYYGGGDEVDIPAICRSVAGTLETAGNLLQCSFRPQEAGKLCKPQGLQVKPRRSPLPTLCYSISNRHPVQALRCTTTSRCLEAQRLPPCSCSRCRKGVRGRRHTPCGCKRLNPRPFRRGICHNPLLTMTSC